ncbi:hypothetical protein N7510_001199 [Penicillium lagena]|uniref:uncharacterized protein n=1 Tax=Penicillium lagena TaxID=94218 RepID=UPI00253F852D|nr:uncharacterized protein N7510_001199 [Penicillium lagena]KAJ5624890.1 hypothetical protein N7510_001199 [Penicillium lagena]
MFVSQTSFRKKRTRVQVTTQGDPGKKSHNTQISNAGHEVLQAPLQLSSLAQSKKDDQIAILVKNYVPEDEIPYIKDCPDDKQSRICGAWVEALPTLSNQTNQDSVLPAAIESLATSLMHQNPQRNGHIIDSTHSYHKAIQALRHGFDATDCPFHAEFAAAIMCLSLTEVSKLS